MDSAETVSDGDVLPAIPTGLSPQQQRFLKRYQAIGSIRAACKTSRVTYKQVQAWRENSPEFVQALDAAHDALVDMAEAEIYRRGVLGYDEDCQTARGEKITMRRYSDSLAVAWLRAHKPSYRDSGKAPVNIAISATGEKASFDFSRFAALLAGDV